MAAGGVNGTTTGACVCATNPAPFGQGQGTLGYMPVDQPGEKGQPVTLKLANSCPPQPRGDLLAMRNPTCDIRACEDPAPDQKKQPTPPPIP